MVLGMLWIVSVYGLGIAFVHLAHYFSTQHHHRDAGDIRGIRYIRDIRDIRISSSDRHVRRNSSREVHHTIESFQSETYIEWAIRSLLLSAWLRGESLRITVIDRGSTDDTLGIIRRLSFGLAPQTICLVTAAQ